VLPLADKILRCEEVFAEAGLPAVVRITPFTRPAALDAELEARGYRRRDETLVLVRPELPPIAVPAAAGLSVETIGPARFAQIAGGLRQASIALREAHAERLANAPVPFTGWLLRRDSEIVACGQHAIEGDLVGLYDIYTVEAARGQGLAGALCVQMLEHARSLGARHAYLQVEARNAPALRLYRRLGFTDGYRYHYRIRERA
jgi:ribosomal protein S18 acetylase RimI-like enzyme